MQTVSCCAVTAPSTNPPHCLKIAVLLKKKEETSGLVRFKTAQTEETSISLNLITFRRLFIHLFLPVNNLTAVIIDLTRPV